MTSPVHPDWPLAAPLTTERLLLEPLRVEHADEMAPLLDDPRLHAYIGGCPATLGELRARYGRLTGGRSPDGAARWCNWVIRRRDTSEAAGTVQATITAQDDGTVAEIAWVVASKHQGHGYAREATRAMVAWLRELGVDAVIAHIHPDHRASIAVARAVGLTPTDTIVHGEVRWRG
jgi:RimJ/RimL family protein N-acetyltransferase